MLGKTLYMNANLAGCVVYNGVETMWIVRNQSQKIAEL